MALALIVTMSHLHLFVIDVLEARHWTTKWMISGVSCWAWDPLLARKAQVFCLRNESCFLVPVLHIMTHCVLQQGELIASLYAARPHLLGIDSPTLGPSLVSFASVAQLEALFAY